MSSIPWEWHGWRQFAEEIAELISTSRPLNDAYWVHSQDAKIVAISLSCVAILLSTLHIFQHLRCFTMPQIQVYVVRLLFTCPVYAIASTVALLVGEKGAVYAEAVRDIYEAVVVHSFFNLILEYGGGETDCVYAIENEPPVTLPAPLCCIMRARNAKLLRFCHQGVLQFMIIKPLMTLINICLLIGGVSKSTAWEWIQAIVYNASYCWALYCLAVFYSAVASVISAFRPLAKFATVKSLVVATYYQGLALHAGLSVPSTSLEWNDFLLSAEMIIFALAFRVAFPSTEFLGGLPSRDILRNLGECLSLGDVFQNVVHNFAPTYSDYALQRSEAEVPASIPDANYKITGDLGAVGREMTERYRGQRGAARGLHTVLRATNRISARMRRHLPTSSDESEEDDSGVLLNDRGDGWNDDGDGLETLEAGGRRTRNKWNLYSDDPQPSSSRFMNSSTDSKYTPNHNFELAVNTDASDDSSSEHIRPGYPHPPRRGKSRSRQMVLGCPPGYNQVATNGLAGVFGFGGAESVRPGEYASLQCHGDALEVADMIVEFAPQEGVTWQPPTNNIVAESKCRFPWQDNNGMEPSSESVRLLGLTTADDDTNSFRGVDTSTAVFDFTSQRLTSEASGTSTIRSKLLDTPIIVPSQQSVDQAVDSAARAAHKAARRAKRKQRGAAAVLAKETMSTTTTDGALLEQPNEEPTELPVIGRLSLSVGGAKGYRSNSAPSSAPTKQNNVFSFSTHSDCEEDIDLSLTTTISVNTVDPIVNVESSDVLVLPPPPAAPIIVHLDEAELRSLADVPPALLPPPFSDCESEPLSLTIANNTNINSDSVVLEDGHHSMIPLDESIVFDARFESSSSDEWSDFH